MLTQYTLTLRPDRPVRARSEWGYRLYAALLTAAPPSFGAWTHQEGATPVSQYLRVEGDRLVWTVSLLGEECEGALGPVLDGLAVLPLEKDRVSLAVTGRSVRHIPDADALFAAPGGIHTLHFHTAAAFKSQGRYVNLPTPRLILQSLVKKWNGCVAECPIDDEDGEGLEAMAAGLRCRSFRLHDRIYYLKGSSIPGFVGELTLENRLSGFHRQLADALLTFSGFAGVGIKTTLGMGGVEHNVK